MPLTLPKIVPPPPKEIVATAPPDLKKQAAESTKPKYAAKGKKEEKPKFVINGNSEQIIAAISKLKGDQVVVRGNAIPVVTRLPTGVFEFDFYTGGGFPNGRYTIIYGPESSGKTNICLLAVAQAQRLPGPCNKAVWVNVEQTFDPIWAAKLGVDIEALFVVNAGYGEEACDIIDALVRAEDVAILVVDSIAALVPSKERDQSAEGFDVGSASLLIKRMVNKLMVAFAEESRRNHFPCVILVNQTRYKIGVQFGDPETMPGGEAQKFLSSLRIRLYGKNVINNKINPNLPVFKNTHAIIKKAKVPVISVDFSFDLCMLEHDELKLGDTRSFNMVKTHLQTLGYLEQKTKGYEIQGEMMESLQMENGKPIKKWVPRVWKTLAAIADQYYTDVGFKLRLQKTVIDSFQEKAFQVEEPQQGASAEIQPGTPVEYDPETGNLKPVVLKNSMFQDKVAALLPGVE